MIASAPLVEFLVKGLHPLLNRIMVQRPFRRVKIESLVAGTNQRKFWYIGVQSVDHLLVTFVFISNSNSAQMEVVELWKSRVMRSLQSITFLLIKKPPIHLEGLQICSSWSEGEETIWIKVHKVLRGRSSSRTASRFGYKLAGEGYFTPGEVGATDMEDRKRFEEYKKRFPYDVTVGGGAGLKDNIQGGLELMVAFSGNFNGGEARNIPLQRTKCSGCMEIEKDRKM
ncbi:hypothetical protein B0J17DRAFT_633868 [Rhizoctonia solani]|nr:hypothetical protein B0J17DRAFT_633868 [Rhizoctonia solani]